MKAIYKNIKSKQFLLETNYKSLKTISNNSFFFSANIHNKTYNVSKNKRNSIIHRKDNRDFIINKLFYKYNSKKIFNKLFSNSKSIESKEDQALDDLDSLISKIELFNNEISKLKGEYNEISSKTNTKEEIITKSTEALKKLYTLLNNIQISKNIKKEHIIKNTIIFSITQKMLTEVYNFLIKIDLSLDERLLHYFHCIINSLINKKLLFEISLVKDLEINNTNNINNENTFDNVFETRNNRFVNNLREFFLMKTKYLYANKNKNASDSVNNDSLHIHLISIHPTLFNNQLVICYALRLHLLSISDVTKETVSINNQIHQDIKNMWISHLECLNNSLVILNNFSLNELIYSLEVIFLMEKYFLYYNLNNEIAKTFFKYFEEINIRLKNSKTPKEQLSLLRSVFSFKDHLYTKTLNIIPSKESVIDLIKIYTTHLNDLELNDLIIVSCLLLKNKTIVSNSSIGFASKEDLIKIMNKKESELKSMITLSSSNEVINKAKIEKEALIKSLSILHNLLFSVYKDAYISNKLLSLINSEEYYSNNLFNLEGRLLNTNDSDKNKLTVEEAKALTSITILSSLIYSINIEAQEKPNVKNKLNLNNKNPLKNKYLIMEQESVKEAIKQLKPLFTQLEKNIVDMNLISKLECIISPNGFIKFKSSNIKIFNHFFNYYRSFIEYYLNNLRNFKLLNSSSEDIAHVIIISSNLISDYHLLLLQKDYKIDESNTLYLPHSDSFWWNNIKLLFFLEGKVILKDKKNISTDNNTHNNKEDLKNKHNLKHDHSNCSQDHEHTDSCKTIADEIIKDNKAEEVILSIQNLPPNMINPNNNTPIKFHSFIIKELLKMLENITKLYGVECQDEYIKIILNLILEKYKELVQETKNNKRDFPSKQLFILTNILKNEVISNLRILESEIIGKYFNELSNKDVCELLFIVNIPRNVSDYGFKELALKLGERIQQQTKNTVLFNPKLNKELNNEKDYNNILDINTCFNLAQVFAKNSLYCKEFVEYYQELIFSNNQLFKSKVDFKVHLLEVFSHFNTIYSLDENRKTNKKLIGSLELWEEIFSSIVNNLDNIKLRYYCSILKSIDILDNYNKDHKKKIYFLNNDNKEEFYNAFKRNIIERLEIEEFNNEELNEISSLIKLNNELNEDEEFYSNLDSLFIKIKDKNDNSQKILNHSHFNHKH